MEIGGNSHIRAGYFGVVVKVRPTITAAKYNAGTCIGGIMTLSPVPRSQGAGAKLIGVTLTDRSNSKAALTILLFDSNPAAATATDHSAFAFSTEDSRLTLKLSVVQSDWVTIGTECVAQLSGLDDYLSNAENSFSFYAAIVAISTPTFLTTSDLQLVFRFTQE